MKRARLALWLIGAIVYVTNGASAQPIETASFQSEQVELHSVVVDTPRVHIAVACVTRSLGYFTVVGSTG